MISNVEWVKGERAQTTCRQVVVRSNSEAKRVAKGHQEAGRSVTFSAINSRDPKTGERGRLVVVTIREKAEWERMAENESGYGL